MPEDNPKIIRAKVGISFSTNSGYTSNSEHAAHGSSSLVTALSEIINILQVAGQGEEVLKEVRKAGLIS
jgi:hypothetical protein